MVPEMLIAQSIMSLVMTSDLECFFLFWDYVNSLHGSKTELSYLVYTKLIDDNQCGK